MNFSYKVPGREHAYEALPLRLLGRHQAANAAVTLAVLAELKHRGWAIPEQAVRTGLAGVEWPVRVEILSRRPTIVVDAAHNRASIDALVQVLDESFSPRRRLLVFATTQEKDLRGMLDRLAGRFDQVILTRYVGNPRGVPPEELAALLEPTGQRYQVCPDPTAAWSEVLRLATPEDLVCITGSFFIAAEIRHQIRARPFGTKDLSGNDLEN
jgi:dihydrofolate synthase/folylpolyglutamate synthase